MYSHHPFYRPPTQMLLAVLLLGCSPNVWAYLDPSTGSMVVSAIVGIVASMALALKTYWYKFRRWFRRKDGKPVEASKPED